MFSNVAVAGSTGSENVILTGRVMMTSNSLLYGLVERTYGRGSNTATTARSGEYAVTVASVSGIRASSNAIASASPPSCSHRRNAYWLYADAVTVNGTPTFTVVDPIGLVNPMLSSAGRTAIAPSSAVATTTSSRIDSLRSVVPKKSSHEESAKSATVSAASAAMER